MALRSPDLGAERVSPVVVEAEINVYDGLCALRILLTGLVLPAGGVGRVDSHLT